MAVKKTKLLRNLKKLAYVFTICLTAIAIVNFTGIHSHTILANQTNMEQLAIKNPAGLEISEFPLGWIDRIERPQTPAKVANEGINFLIPYTHSYDQQTIETYLDAARDNGVKVFLEPYRKDVKAENATAITEFVRTYKQHPALAGWYTFDEPVVNQISPQTLEITYQAIKAEDPNHPVSIVFAPKQAEQVPRYANAMDIYMINRYPFFYGKSEFNNLGNFNQWMQKAASYAGDKSFWPVLQAYGEQEDGKPKYNRRLPTAAEERYMFYTAISAGADGLLFYGHHWTQQSWVDSVLTPIVREFYDYLPMIRSHDLAVKSSTNRSDIEAVLYQNPQNQKYLLIAIHHGKGQVTAEIEPPISLSNKTVIGSENRNISLNNGVFQDTFNAYDVRVYTIE